MVRDRTASELVASARSFASSAESAVARALSDPDGGGVIGAEEVANLRASVGCSEEELLHRILPFSKLAALPHSSGFQVGAAAQGTSGAIYLGFNLELPGLPFQHTVHAEQSAIYLAADAGEEQLKYVATSTTPCGHCRQFMQELYDSKDLKVSCPDQATRYLGELMPDHFGPEHLDLKDRLLQSKPHDLRAIGGDTAAAGEQLLKMAIGAASKAYVPFGKPSGLALRTRSGLVAAGFPIESVAHNPGMTAAGPLQGALVKLTAIGCRDWTEICTAVLVEHQDAGVRYEDYVALALKAIAPDAELIRVCIG